MKEIRESGVKAVGLPRKRGMTVEDMTGSDWLYKTLKRFRAGIEGNISTETDIRPQPVFMARIGGFQGLCPVQYLCL